MARRGRPTVDIVLSVDERETLERWARRHSSSQALGLRCRIVLACAAGGTNKSVGASLGVHPTTVSKWRLRFAADRLDGLVYGARAGGGPTRGGARVEAGRGPHDRRRRRRGGRGGHVGDRTARRHALVDAGPGRETWDLSHHRGGD